jgi:FkbM family methyltransferase
MNINKLIIPSKNLGNYIIPREVVGGIAVDIGSNVGGFIEQASQLFKKIYYYEPIKECFEICSKISSKYDHIHGYNVAVSSKRGVANVIMHKNCLAGSSAVDCLSSDILSLEHGDRNNINQTNTISLTDVFDHVKENIDYMKCDCEISEYDIFMNQDLSKIKYIGIELHWQMGEERYSELVNYMLQTHGLVYGDISFPGEFNNREVLLRIKS